MYANGRGVLQDDKEAVKWYRLAVELTNPDAQFNLGVMSVSYTHLTLPTILLV